MANAGQHPGQPQAPRRAVLSQPLERLLEEQAAAPTVIDVVVVGSGYGGAVAAARLAGATAGRSRLSVVVLERGREYLPGDFPNRAALLPGHTRLSREGATQPAGVREGLFDLRLGQRVSALVANGLGGGSLINAGLMARPDPELRDQLLGWQPADGRAARDRLALELEDCFLRAERMLGAETAPAETHQSVPLAKRARLADLGRVAGQPHEPAAVTIAFKPQPVNGEAKGFTQQLEKCVHCGDCFSGCNIGAKKSLDTNYLALARARGARLFSGATVTHLQPLTDANSEGARWAVHLELTDEKLARGDRQPPPLRARWVILAAGTFGTFEILSRSKQAGWPLASSALGRRFSGNGDSICAIHDPATDANSVADEAVLPAARAVGPTITGLVRARSDGGTTFVVQDLAAPAPLQRLFEEVVTTQRLLMAIGQFDWSTHRAAPAGQDPLAIDPAVIRRTAVYAAMGDDGAAGQLRRSPQWRGDGGVFADWPRNHAPSQRLYEAQIQWFRSALPGRQASLVPNPLWQPLPEGLSELFGGVGGGLLTVHPLGGCRMSEGPAEGVVDFRGRLFKGDSSPLAVDGPRFHDGLLVVDGSVLPGAVGINPALTIAALAERSIARLMAEQRWTESAAELDPLKPQALQPPVGVLQGATSIDLKERMSGRIRPLPAAVEVEATVTLASRPIDDLMGFLRRGDRVVAFERATLGLTRGAETKEFPLCDAQLQVLVLGGSSALRRMARGIRALWVNRRHDLLAGRSSARALLALLRTPLATLRKLVFLLTFLPAFATQFGERRRLVYRFTLPEGAVCDGVTLPKDTVLTGVKTLEYGVDANPWEQLMQLALHQGDDRGPVIGTLRVDLGYFAQVQQPLLSLRAQRDQPSALMDLLSFGLFVGRTLAKIHFWSFRLPDDYPQPVVDDDDLRRRRLPQPGLGEARFEQHVCRFPDGTPRLTLSHYVPGMPPGKTDPPVVLIHGFSASGSTFAHPAIPDNLVQTLLAHGRQVWVADLRTSIGHRSAAHTATAFDEVARTDLVDAIRMAYVANEGKPVDVIAHCIGAAMFCQAAMLGTLRCGTVSMVRAAVLSQTAPLVRMQPQNHLRAFLAMYLRHFIAVETLDPLRADFAGVQGNLIDRLLATFPYPPAERARMSGRLGPAPYARYRARTDAVFGQLFKLEHLQESTLAALPDLLGEINLDSYAQTIHWVRRGLLTDMHGEQALARVSLMHKHFDFAVLFLHGRDNEVFSVEGARASLALLRPADDDNSRMFKLAEVDGYGHQDIFLGRLASAQAARRILDFLDQPPNTDRLRREMAVSSRAPTLGPVLGWLRKTQDGRFVQRVLVGENLAAPTARFSFSATSGRPLTAQPVWPPPAGHTVARVQIVDVEVPSQGAVEVVAENLVQVPGGGDVPVNVVRVA